MTALQVSSQPKRARENKFLRLLLPSRSTPENALEPWNRAAARQGKAVNNVLAAPASE
jgi:hypothetical protein